MRRFPITQVLLATAAVLGAQDIAQGPLESVHVAGNRRIPVEKILALLDLKTGKTVSRADFDAARERLTATRAFDAVGYEYRLAADGAGFDLTMEVREVDQVFPYRFEDLSVAENVLRGAMRAQEPLWGDEIPITSVEQYVDTIVQAGVRFAVTWKVEEPAGVETIVFHPAATVPRISEVRFTGNDALPTAALLRPISDVAVGIPYTEKALRERLDTAIRPLYDARGRIRVAFPKLEAERAAKLDGVVVTVTVDEGPVYKLGEVRFTGVADADAEDLSRSADLRKGDPAHFDDVRAAVERVEKKYRDRGYLHIESKVAREIHDEARTVDVAVALEPGAQFRFGKLTIKGLDILSEPEIRKTWGQMEGLP